MREVKKIKVEVEFTPGYEQRFTAAVLKIYGNRIKRKSRRTSGSGLPQDRGVKGMDGNKIEKLYALLERAEREKDAEAVAALRWAIFHLEN